MHKVLTLALTGNYVLKIAIFEQLAIRKIEKKCK